MKFFQETTVWDSPAMNHIYYMKDDKSFMVGYIQAGTKSLFKFKKPIQIDTRGRKFVELKDKKVESDSVYFAKPQESKGEVIKVEGSNGKVYTIEKIASKYVCSCPGFMFRHKCKHVESLK